MGKWPVDPLLDEVEEAQRRIMARHGNDWRKVLLYYAELDHERRERDAQVDQPPAGPGESAA